MPEIHTTYWNPRPVPTLGRVDKTSYMAGYSDGYRGYRHAEAILSERGGYRHPGEISTDRHYDDGYAHGTADRTQQKLDRVSIIA